MLQTLKDVDWSNFREAFPVQKRPLLVVGGPRFDEGPMVAAAPKCGGSKASIWLRCASTASISASGVPQRAVITSSVGS